MRRALAFLYQRIPVHLFLICNIRIPFYVPLRNEDNTKLCYYFDDTLFRGNEKRLF